MNDKSQNILAYPQFYLLIIIVLLVFIYTEERTINQQKKDLDFYRSTYLIKNGCTSLWSGSKGEMICYNLISLDGGKNWYAFERNEDNIKRILGPAEVVYPGLMGTLKAWEDVVNYATKNGPINLDNTKGMELLQKVGIEVKRNTN